MFGCLLGTDFMSLLFAFFFTNFDIFTIYLYAEDPYEENTIC